MKPENIKIVSAKACLPILRRIAYQIYEANYNVNTLILLGISERGYRIAQIIAENLQQISGKEIRCYQLDTTIQNLEVASAVVNQQNCILIDDVLYTGNTLFLAATHLVTLNPARLQTAVLVDRGHRLLPISADFVGLELATTLHEYISVIMEQDGKSFEVFLS